MSHSAPPESNEKAYLGIFPGFVPEKMTLYPESFGNRQAAGPFADSGIAVCDAENRLVLMKDCSLSRFCIDIDSRSVFNYAHG